MSLRGLILVIMITTFGSIDFPHYSLVPKAFGDNLAFRAEILKKCSEDKGFADNVRQMCAEDILFYANTFCWTYDPRQKIRKLPFITYEEFQDEAIASICDAIIVGEDVAMPKSRCMGASWMGLLCFEWMWHFQSDMSFLVISRNEKYVDESGNPKTLFWKLDFLHANQPKWLLPTGRWLGDKDPNRRLLHLGNADNGSVIDGESTTGDAGRGDRRTAMFIDEHAAFDPSDGYKVLRATRDTTKCRIFNSTPQGVNAFHEVVYNTASRVIRMHWSDHPEYNKGLYTSKDGKLILLDKVLVGPVKVTRKGWKNAKTVNFPEEYPFILDGKLRSPWFDTECSRCVSETEIAQELNIDFLGSAYQFFDSQSIAELVKQNCLEPFNVGMVDYDRESLSPGGFTSDAKGSLKLWLFVDGNGRIDPCRRFGIGCDISAGTGASNSAASVVDMTSGEKVAVWLNSKTLPIDFADVCIALGRYFNNATLNWDASGPTGKTFTSRVIRQKYPYLYYRSSEDKVRRKISEQPGFYLNPEARASLLEEYRDALGKQLFINRSRSGMQECLQFIVLPGGKVEHSASVNSQDPTGARSAHGDEAIADALANKIYTDRHKIREPKEPEIPVGSLAYRMRQAELLAMSAKQQGMRELGKGW